MIKWYAYKKNYIKKNNDIISNKDCYLKINKNHSSVLNDDQKIKVFKGSIFKFIDQDSLYYIVNLPNSSISTKEIIQPLNTNKSNLIQNKEIKKIYISIGWRCDSAVLRSKIYPVNYPLYKTCPFDLMISNLDGIIKCFENNFEYFCNPTYLVYNGNGDGNNFIKNTFYNFMFNHETPGHADLYLKESWPGNNKYHFTENNFKNFIDRYNRRISNLKNYIDENDHIIFILQMVYVNENNPLLLKFKNILKEKYPNKIFSFHLFTEPNKNFFETHMNIAGVKKDIINLSL